MSLQKRLVVICDECKREFECSLPNLSPEHARRESCSVGWHSWMNLDGSVATKRGDTCRECAIRDRQKARMPQ